MAAAPATKGMKVRTIGTKRASTIAFPPWLLEEVVRSLQVLRVEQALQPTAAAFRPEHPRAEIAADAVVHRVPGNRRCEQQERDDADVERPGRRDRARGKEQGIPRQERRDHQSGLGEDDREQQRVHGRSVRLDESREVNVEMEEKVDEVCHSHTHCSGQAFSTNVNVAALPSAVSATCISRAEE